MPKGQKKIFLGFTVKQAFINALNLYFEEIKLQLAEYPIRFIAPANYHLTLKYMGWTDDAKVRSLMEKLQTFICPQVLITPIYYSWLGKFSPRALTLEFSHTSLIGLVKKCNQHFIKEGIYIEPDGLRPHLTFARHKGKISIVRQLALENIVEHLPCLKQELLLDRLILYESVMREGQVTYEKLCVQPLQIG
ncbi:MAG: hypothetical protein KDK51_10725 [Deltaproteobacteria bacterium]|nr:hypothetical protein [Deltaproteobacteria bacterium]